MSRLLIGGGKGDPNLTWLKQAADALGVGCDCVLVEPDEPPDFSWSVGEPYFTIDGQRVECSAAFLRYDVFSGMAANSARGAANAAAWFSALNGYCEALGVTTLNQHIDPVTGSKPAMLVHAARHGLAIPKTLISNSRGDIERLGGPAQHIAKPVAGGSYVMGLDEALAGTSWERGLSPAPH